jgi:anion-transporting  ArsA/GET3 family ATPase
VPGAGVRSAPPPRARGASPLGVASRLWIVTGKGGTGRTSVAAALALCAARAGERVLLAGSAADGALPALLEIAEPHAAQEQPLEVEPGLFALLLSPERALAEYVELQLPLGGLGKRLLASRAFRAFLDAAPGWRDLVALGKLVQLEQERAGGRPRFDRIVLDAPATGHALSMLSTPQVVLDVVRMGPLRRVAEAVRALLVDPRRTQCILVTLAEELPVCETLELAAALRRIAVAVGPVLVNRREPEPGLDLAELRAALGRVPARGAPALARPRALAAALAFQQLRCAQQRHWVAALERELSPVHSVADLVEPLEGRRGVGRLADLLAQGAAEARP